MNALEKILLAPVAAKYQGIGIYYGSGAELRRVAFRGDCPEQIGDGFTVEKILFENQELGCVAARGGSRLELYELARVVAPLFVYTDGKSELLERNMRILQWVWNAKEIEPRLCNWTGIYFKESFLRGSTSTDLILGPFIGLSTDHVRIPIDKGFCGLALREERVVNVKDVREDTRHIACNISTRAELVIPLKDAYGQLVAELDIDSDTLAAFTEKEEEQFVAHAETFAALLH